MDTPISRRKAIGGIGWLGANAFAALSAPRAHPCSPNAAVSEEALTIAGSPVELLLTAVSSHTLRVSLVPRDKATQTVNDFVLALSNWPGPFARFRQKTEARLLDWGKLRLKVATDPLSVVILDSRDAVIQSLNFDPPSGGIQFALGEGLLLGLGEGGPQFDRRGSFFAMKHGQDVPELATDGARVPIPWIIGTNGWGLFFHQPYGTLDLRAKLGVFAPRRSEEALPVDLFVVISSSPQVILREFAQLTGFPHLPPLWSFGYQQSHRTLASREEVLSEAKRFRQEKLPCDVLIYLGTGFCPSGWNTGHGSFVFNTKVFDDPESILQELHRENFRVVLHVVNPPRHLAAGGHDSTTAAYWKEHEPLMRLGVDGWWADEGDELGEQSCLARNRMYWEGQVRDRPNFRPYTLNRNGYAGLQRYGWLWSGDIECTWEALRRQIAVGINTGLSGIPYWGTDTGGFVTTRELTGELFVRWFQFSAFCPLFRSHGRTWKLRLPWGWNTGDYGPTEIDGYGAPAGLPDVSELHNPQVEPICRKYLDLRYRLLPYLYSLAQESHTTGLPMMRALWIHYPHDPRAVVRDDEYLWGKDILVAPVTEKQAASRCVYLPEGAWFDFWTEEIIQGGREIRRPVDLATLPLYVRSGAILPMGPSKQFALEGASQPLSVVVYPGSDGEFLMYEDDGLTFDFLKGQAAWLGFRWDNRAKRVTVNLQKGSRYSSSLTKKIDIRVAGQAKVHTLIFKGNPVGLSLQEA